MKKYKNVVVSGCSFMYCTYPFETNRVDKGWNKDIEMDPNDELINHTHKLSRLLAKKLNCEEHNVSVPGSGNREIIRNLYEWTKDKGREDKLLLRTRPELEKTLMIVGLSDINRFPIYAPSPLGEYFKASADQFGYKSENNFIKNSKDWMENKPYDVSLDVLKTYIQTYYTYFYDEHERVRELNQDLELFQSYCDQNKIDVVFFGSLFGLGWDYKDDSNRWSNFFISRDECFLNNFDTKNINYFTFPDGVKDWRSHIYSYDETYAYGHPNIYDNVVLADLLFDYIKEINS